jgi:AcrR family transcriptional regulator
MPRANPERRDQLADAAIEVLAQDGARGLTHRAVDAAAGVPSGTTSRYFRTREALVQAIVRRALGSLAASLQQMGAVPRPPGPDALADAVAQTVRDAVTARRARSAAIFELMLEGRRNDELGLQVNEARNALMELLRQIGKATEVELSDRQVVQLLILATGTVVTALTAPAEAGRPGELFGETVETLVRNAVTAILLAG